MIKLLITFSILLISLSSSALIESEKYCDNLISSGIEFMEKQQYVKAINCHLRAKTISFKKTYKKQYFLSLNNLGIDYFNLNDIDNALKYYLMAYNYANKIDDHKGKMIILNNISVVYISFGELKKAEKYLKLAITQAEFLNDQQRIVNYKTNLGLLLIDQFNINGAEKELKSALNLAKVNSCSSWNIQLGLLKIKLLKNQNAEVIAQINKVFQNKKLNKYSKEYLEYHYILSQAYNQLNQHNNAINTLLQILDKHETPISKREYFELLILLYYKTGNVDSANKYTKQLNEILQENSKSEYRSNIEKNKAKFELIISQDELIQEKKKGTLKNIIAILSLLVSVLFVIIISILYKKNAKRLSLFKKEKNAELNKHMIELKKVNRKNQNLSDQMVSKSEIWNKEKEYFTQELENRNKKIAEKIMLQSKRNELIKELILKLENDAKYVNDFTQLKQLKEIIQQETSLTQFLESFEELNPNFIKLLKQNHPEINAEDIRFLSFIYSNLNTKEIAKLLNIAPESVRKRKERISKKLKIKENMSLYDYLFELDLKMSHNITV